MSADRPTVEALIVDTSVLVRFFHRYDDALEAPSQRLLEWWAQGHVDLVLLDLAIHEFVNVLVRGLRLSAAQVREGVEGLFDLQLPMVRVDQALATDAALLAAERRLSGYDAAFVAAARRLRVPLITADRRLADRCPEEALLLAAD